jgi:hypothetical protein
MSEDAAETRSEAARALRAAWDDLIAELERAREAIDQPERMPPPQNDRNLAEGYRYLMGFVHSAIERALHCDPDFPVVRNLIHPINKATIDNADAIYFAAPIDGRHAYWLRGEAGDHRHWRGEPRRKTGRLAPQYLIFELSDGCLAGDSGSLAELRPGVKAMTGRLDSSELEVGPDGRFEILLAAERPRGYAGNFIASRRESSRPSPDDPTASRERFATHVSGRQLFYDWQNEDPVPLSLTRIGREGEHPPAYGPQAAAAQLRSLGALVRGQMHFWNEFYTVLLETHGKPVETGARDGKPDERFMPRNALNAVNAAARETGGGQSTNLYAGGVYELEPDEALIVETRIPVTPQYVGFHLSNLWGESHDFANHQSSLNGFQVELDPDGVLRWVVAHRDPGVPNWVDTTGHREGFLTPRWAYSQTPDPAQWPTIAATKVRWDELRSHLPKGVRRVSPEERREGIRVRQEHVKRRYRI